MQCYSMLNTTLTSYNITQLEIFTSTTLVLSF